MKSSSLGVIFLCSYCLATGGTTRLIEPAGGGTAASAAPSEVNHFMFAVAGDNRAAGRGLPAPPTTRQIFSELRLLRPALTLWTGDVIYGNDDSLEGARAEYRDFLETVTIGGAPLYNAPGNHEIAGRRELESVYRECLGGLYGSFDYGHSHFIVLDTEEIGVRTGISDGQMEWLREDLKRNRDAAHTFVVMHRPVFPRRASQPDAGVRGSELHALFVQAHVTMVFSGHEHLYRRSEHDGVSYVITGGAGAPSQVSPAEGGFEHYLLVRVNGADVAVTVLEPWRLITSARAVTSGSASIDVGNYNAVALPVYVELPLRAHHATATVSYNGHTQELPVATMAAPRADATDVRLSVPPGRTAHVSAAGG